MTGVRVEKGVDKVLPWSRDRVLLHPPGPSSMKDKVRPQEGLSSKIVKQVSTLRGLCWTPRGKALHLGGAELFPMGKQA